MSRTRTRSKKGTSDAGQKRDRSGGPAAQRAERFMDMLLPESEYPSGTDYSDRQSKLTVLQEFRRAQGRAVSVFDRIEMILDAEEASEEDEVEVASEDRKIKRELEARVTEDREARTNIRLALEIGERELEARDTSRGRHLFMALTAISVVATIGLAYLSALRGEPLYDGGSLIGALLSVGCVLTLRLLAPSPRP